MCDMFVGMIIDKYNNGQAILQGKRRHEHSSSFVTMDHRDELYDIVIDVLA